MTSCKLLIFRGSSFSLWHVFSNGQFRGNRERRTWRSYDMPIRQMVTDNSQYRKLDPSLLLLSELEILAAQTRLIEIYIKQAKTEAEIETARIHEQYQSQLAKLTAEIDEKETILVDLRTKLDEIGGPGQNRLQVLQTQLREQQSLLDRRSDEIERTESELASLRAQIVQLEFSQNQKDAAAQEAQRTRDRLEADLVRLRTELENTSLNLEEQRRLSGQREESLRRELHELTTRWTEQQERSNAKESQLREAGEKITTLSERVHDLEQDRTEAYARAARESEQIRATFEGRLADLQAVLEQKDQSLGETQSAFSESERRFQAEIGELRNQLADKQQRLNSRDGELGELRAQMAGLEERAQQFATANEQSIAIAQDSERVRRELESEIAGLRFELASKEQALADRQAALTELEEVLRSRTEELQRQHEQTRQRFDLKELEIQNLRSETTSLSARIAELETALETGQASIHKADEIRGTFETQLAELRATLAEKEIALAEQEQSFAIVQTRLTGELKDLQDRLAAKDADLNTHTSELQQAQADITTLIEQKAKLELLQTQTERLLSAQADQIRQQVRAELATLENNLQEKDERLRATQQRIAQSEEYFDAKVSGLQLQLAEKQLLVEARQSEIDNLKLHISQLSEQMSGLESDNRRIETAASGTADGLRNELSKIQEQLRRTELLLEEQEAKAVLLEEARAQEVRELQEELALTQRSVEDRERSLEKARAGTVELQERLGQLELSNQLEKAAAKQADEARTVCQVEAETLRSELQQKEWALAQRQIAVENLAQAHKAQIQKLEAKALEQQQLAQSYSRDLEKAQSEAVALRDHITQLETAVEQAQATGGHRTAQLEQQHEERLTGLQRDLEQRVLELHERTRLSEQSESALHDEIQRLRKEAQEKHALLENRNEEVLLAKSEMDLLRQRLAQVETEARRNEEAGATENDKMRAEFQAELAFLQAELSQKEWALDERQGTVNGLAQDLTAQVQDLQTQLAEKEALLEARAAAGVADKLEPTESEKERLQRMEKLVAAAINVENSFPASRKRRWRTRLGWKNRWGS